MQLERRLDMLSGLFVSKMVEIARDYRTYHEEVRDLFSPIIISVTKSRSMVWVRHVACMGKREIHTRFLW